MLVVSTDGEHLTCGGFSLSKNVCLGSFEFITNYFGGLGLSPRRSDSRTAFMDSTYSRPPSSWWAMIEDSTEEYHTTLSGGGGSGLPSPRRLDAGLCMLPSQPHRGRRMLLPFSL
jgi:hypothetical protein